MFMKKYQLLNTFQWLLMTLFFLYGAQNEAYKTIY